jgi:hypothetical protein
MHALLNDQPRPVTVVQGRQTDGVGCIHLGKVGIRVEDGGIVLDPVLKAGVRSLI